MELRGKRALVTGASRGIGLSIAEAFAAAGARVALVARTRSAIDALAARLGGTAHACDLGDPAQLAGLVGRIEAEGGTLDILVNNAALEVVGAIEGTSAEDLDQLFRVNLIAPAELCRQALPGMLARGVGHVVNLSSVAGSAPFPGLAAYGASKAGLAHWTACLRGELSGTGVKATLVELGPVPTEMLSSVKAYPPSEAAFARAYRLHLVRDVTREDAAASVVEAVRSERTHVRLPRRTAPFGMLAEVPRALAEWILVGLPRRAR